MINQEKLKQYRMAQTADIPNIKTAIGKTMTPVTCLVSEYTGKDSNLHKVMCIDFGMDGMYRTETTAFIEKFNDYWTNFGEEEEKPPIKITGKNSKLGNPYTSFELAI